MRILFVAMGQSVHTARWISQIADQGWDIHVFDMQEASVCPELVAATTYTVHPPRSGHLGLKGWKSSYPLRRGAGFVKRNFPDSVARRMFADRIPKLARLIETLRPDIIHSLEMQNESYPLLDVKRQLGGSFSMPWIYSVWGSDIYHFGKQPEHRERIREVLDSCDYLIADCERDVGLAREFGFRGDILGVFPTAGGYEVEELRKLIELTQTSKRKSIALKGLQNWHGRALLAIQALGLCRDLLKGYSLEIYLSVPSVDESARDFAQTSGIPVTIHPQTLNSEILKLFGRSRIGFSMSVTDGSPNAMLEAMIMGAFPVQSDTVSTAEWINDGENGYLVPPEDPEKAAQKLKLALQNDDLVDRSAEINRKMMIDRIDRSLLKGKIVELYNEVLRRGKKV